MITKIVLTAIILVTPGVPVKYTQDDFTDVQQCVNRAAQVLEINGIDRSFVVCEVFHDNRQQKSTSLKM